jgi:hypothetical protein
MAEAEAEFDPTLDSTATNVARVMKHVLQKGFRMGGVLGVGVVAPVLLYRHTRRVGHGAGRALCSHLSCCFGLMLMATQTFTKN